MGKLTVFKASAGSGKTFSLTARFIGLLVSNPAAYKEILAVTFTTKATEEMKNRILSQLYGLAAGLSESDVYLREITSVYGFSETFVREQARRALALILHDYGNFNVETIDSFFQRVLRGIARELELNCNMRVELGQDEVEQLAVDRLLTNLRPNDKELAWIMDYIRQNILDDKKWNVLDAIRKFGKTIFTDDYRENAKAIDEAINKEGFFAAFRNRLRSDMDTAMSEMAAVGNGFFELIAAHGYSINDFVRGTRGPAAYFAKLRDGVWFDSKTFNETAAKAAQDAKAWLRKDDQYGAILAFAEEQLVPLIAHAEEQRQKAAVSYLSAQAVLANLNEVRLLRKIEQGVEEVNKETNSLMLSDTQMLLKQLMEGSDAPFVYEKTGARITHIMIDEMQDTSVVQWENFKKLLLECLARDCSQNLIVGDVKQSIYRWRNSDWRILNNIAEDNSLKDKDLQIETLLTNYRSEPGIIAFNNAFFRLAARQEQARLEAEGVPGAELIGSIYSDGETQQQCASSGNGGRVKVALLDKDDKSSRCVEMIAEHISKLLAAGVKEEDIAIIARRNKDIEAIGADIERLLPHCRFVSDEAFKLSSSVALNIIVNAMRVAAGIQPAFYSATLAWDYSVYIRNLDPAGIVFRDKESISKLLPEAFVKEKETLSKMPLTAMAAAISAMFSIERLQGEAAYVNMFFDSLAAFVRTNLPDAAAFSDFWDKTLGAKTVKGGDVPGVRMMTIHKSKGLEFAHVIVPYCDWKLELDTTLWCKSSEEPYCEMPVVPVKSSKLRETVYQNDYFEEKLNNTVDNLNLLYVAFTRARRDLFVIGKRSISKGSISFARRSGLVESVIRDIETELSPARCNVGDTDNDVFFEFGEVGTIVATTTHSENIFTPSKAKLTVPLAAPATQIAFRQSNRSRAFVCGEEDDSERQQYIRQGTLLHNLLSQIADRNDAGRVLDAFIAEGVLEKENRESLAKLIRNRLEHNSDARVNEWFAPGITTLNECTILSPDAQTGLAQRLRPDRVVQLGARTVVIDFKFAAPKAEHHAQVRRYMSLLSDMGRSVEGFLWYVYDNKIAQVTPTSTI
ncbi:MAG: UvrD-helicase domain-containing protein [Prevotella sp.]|nr:UvrD-helicase domain-containing protein [Prevotella sp.]